MNELDDLNSGYINPDGTEAGFTNSFTDIEILRTTDFNLLARARRHGRQWLLKGLPEPIRHSASHLRHLMKEFEIHSRLNHPGIARVMTCEEVEGLGPCIVMEWIEGETLQDYILKNRLSFADRRQILEDIVDAVGYMHGMGVSHRDLKPTNIMIRKAGEAPVIIDFGLADTDDYIELKQSAGTEGYISPEQIERGGTDTSDDIFSLGVIIRLLCPEYSRLASLCQKPKGKRPKDGTVLRKKLISRRKRPKRILFFLLAIIIVVLITGAGYAIREWKHQALEAYKTSERLKAGNEESTKRVGVLRDSLDVITTRMVSLEAEKKQQEEYAAKVLNAHNAGKAKVRNFYTSYETNVINKVLKSDQGTMAVNINLMMPDFYEEMKAMIDKYTSDLQSQGITPLDCDRINTDLKSYFYEINTPYVKRWMDRANATH